MLGKDQELVVYTYIVYIFGGQAILLWPLQIAAVGVKEAPNDEENYGMEDSQFSQMFQMLSYVNLFCLPLEKEKL